MDIRERYRGCLVGGAVGDALGYPIEFWGAQRITDTYGAAGKREYTLSCGVAQISDDTQMTLFTADGLLMGFTRGRLRGILASPQSYIFRSYKDWYFTQTGKQLYDDNINEFYYSWLKDIPELNHQRAPGNTCMSATNSCIQGSVETPINNSKGCGGIMRVAPVGLYLHDKYEDAEQVAMVGAQVAAITHGHELGYIPAAGLAYLINLLSHEEEATLLQAVKCSNEVCGKLFSDAVYLGDYLDLIQLAIELAQTDISDSKGINQLGKGWVAEETMAIAVFCALRHQDSFEDAVVAAVSHGGDSDSTGAVAGNIMGAYLGMKAIPNKYLINLELRDLIIEIADDLYDDCPMEDSYDSVDPIWEAKYIEKNYYPIWREKRNN